MTKGEYRVGIGFNPSNDDMVGKIKRQASHLIDLVEAIPDALIEDETKYHEVRRLKSLAQTEIESAAMWAVKAATKPAPPSQN
jgi:hypothetical protein